MAGIVVTGASSGIGRAIAIRLAQDAVSRQSLADARMLIHYRRNREGAEATANEIKRLGMECEILAADLGHISAAEQFAREALDRVGPIVTWVNNAGADVLTGEPSSWSFDRKLRWLLDVDVCGTAAISRIVGPAMADRGAVANGETESTAPSMVFIGWDQANAGMEGDAGMMFGPVKAAVMALAKSLAQTLAPRVRVNCIAPGWIQTAWGESTSEYWNERATTQSLMNRWGRGDDVAAAVAYVTSPEAGFITGQTINVNGGWNRRYRGIDASAGL